MPALSPSLLETVQPLFDAIESLIKPIKSLIKPIKSLINPIEAFIHACLGAVEPASHLVTHIYNTLLRCRHPQV